MAYPRPLPAALPSGVPSPHSQYPWITPRLRELCPWFSGLFTLGMASAPTRTAILPASRTAGGEVLSPSDSDWLVCAPRDSRSLGATIVISC